jgi:hypothetical protein
MSGLLNRHLRSLSGKGDPLADAVIETLDHSPAKAKDLLLHGLQHGRQTIPEAPESIRALLADAELACAETPIETFRRATDSYLLMGPTWISVSLGPGALIHTYSDPSIAAVLSRTGSLLESQAARRLMETQLWSLKILREDGLVIGGQGYVHTLQVRLLHARIRANLIKRGGPPFSSSIPIDQRQLLRTWLDFTVVSFQCLERIGLNFDAKQQSSLYALWRLVGRLLGIESSTLSLVTDHDTANVFLREIDALTAPPDQQSIALSHAMLDAIGQRLATAWRLPTDISILFCASLARHFHGEQLADALNITPNWTEALLTPYTDANRYRLLRAAQDSAFKAEVITKSQSGFAWIESKFEGDTAYQV